MLARNNSSDRSRKSRRVCSYNFKGGVGKSTTTFNLCAQIADMKKSDGSYYKVLMIDADPQCNLTSHVPYRGQEPLVKEDEKEEEDEDGAGASLPSQGSSTPGESKSKRAKLDASSQDYLPAEDYLGAFSVGLHDRLSYQEGIPIEANEDETRSNNLYMALLPYLEPTSWPNGDTCPVLEEVQNFENRLWLLPGVPEVASLDGPLGKLEFKPANLVGKSWAMWNHLMKNLETKYDLDVIVIDLGPAASRFNYLAMLSSDYVLPSCGTGRYDISSSSRFLTFGLKEAVKLGYDILKHQSTSSPALEPHEVLTLKNYIATTEGQGGCFPSIFEHSSWQLPRMPFVHCETAERVAEI